MRKALCVLLALVGSMLSQAVHAKDARVKGVVTDAAGKGLEGVEIDLVDPAIGTHYEVRSKKNGKFFRRAIRPSTYTLTAEKEGYLSHTIENFLVQAGGERKVSIQLMTPDDRKREARLERGGQAYAAGADAYDRGDLEQAVASMTARVAEAPDDGRARLILAESLAGLDRDEEAIPHYEKALELDPSNGSAWQGLAQCYLAAGKTDAAVTAFRRAEDLSPEDPSVPYNVGALLFKDGKLEEAQAAFERALECQPGYPFALNGLGRLLLERQEFARARESLEAYLKAAPDAPDAAEVKTLLEALETLAAESG